MALHEPSEWEDDFVLLSDVEDDKDHVPPLGNPLIPSGKGILRKPMLPRTGRTAHSSHENTLNEPAGSSRQLRRLEDEEGGEDSDIEEIEYGYETDMLLIMPSMLRDYSHHATNYHPELWHAPIPGSSREAPSHPTVARCRQEDRMLDRQELLKNDILPTTCGICFDSFTPLELDSQPPRERPVSSRAQFALSFAARLARSLALVDFNQHHDPSSSSSTSQRIPGAYTSSPFFSSSPLPAQQQQQQQQPTETFSSSSPPSSPTPSDNPSSSTNASCTDQQQQPPTQQQSTVTPSMSSKDIGIVMPCDHGLCLSCLQSFLTSATQNPQARFPTLCPQPGCRTPIPTESAELVLNSETLEIWHRKLAEVHVANKVCCPKPECQSIIDLDDRHGTAVTCPECKSSYCASCAVPFHHGYTCDQYQAQRNDSEADRAMLQLVEDRHWRHCPSCRFVIEKQQGCNHMVCHCGQSFCYACGHAWNEIEARCSSGCERYGDNEQDDAGVECRIM